jgi:methylated-DNA-[protein]-cysteine S-methyltransferase
MGSMKTLSTSIQNIRIEITTIDNMISGISLELTNTNTPPSKTNIQETLKQFLADKNLKTEFEYLNLNPLSPFQLATFKALLKVPSGKVISYGNLSKAMTRSSSPRALGTALGKNPFPLLIPCHRVILGNSHMGQFSAGPHIKRHLLEIEGIRFGSADKILTPAISKLS